ncbi:hypothetical protein U1Q18_023096 [Sarracenia purpurea var. burkii]
MCLHKSLEVVFQPNIGVFFEVQKNFRNKLEGNSVDYCFTWKQELACSGEASGVVAEIRGEFASQVGENPNGAEDRIPNRGARTVIKRKGIESFRSGVIAAEVFRKAWKSRFIPKMEAIGPIW